MLIHQLNMQKFQFIGYRQNVGKTLICIFGFVCIDSLYCSKHLWGKLPLFIEKFAKVFVHWKLDLLLMIFDHFLIVACYHNYASGIASY